MNATLMRLGLFLLMTMSSACGYLDQDLLVDDSEFAESFGIGGIGMSGRSMSIGCGGYGTYSHRSLGPRIRVGTVSEGELEIVGVASLSDDELLQQTDVEVIDESSSYGSANAVERAYFGAIADRDRALAEVY